MFLSATEHKHTAGFKEKGAVAVQKLPFTHCALSLVPFEDPVMTPDGSVFDVRQLVPFVRKHKKNPVTGEPLETRDIKALVFARNTDGQFCCPVTGAWWCGIVRLMAGICEWDAHAGDSKRGVNAVYDSRGALLLSLVESNGGGFLPRFLGLAT